jgi:DNA replication and repair protein RecF
MSLAHLQIHHLRNISSARLELHPRLNFFFGNNGSGKSSLLEAIYLLGTGHSFRTRESLALIQRGKNCLTVFARTLDEHTISIQKTLGLPTQVRLNGLPCHTTSELARFLPSQIFYQDVFQVIDAGPSVRRSVMDWGLFHVKHNYHETWKNYKRALKQRNSLLRQKAPLSKLLPWDKTLADLAAPLHESRLEYIKQLQPLFTGILQSLTSMTCSLNYYKGWDRRQSNKSLLKILEDNYQSDLLKQFTQYGPHHADLAVEVNDLNAKQYLSRGQQKIVLIALKVSQGLLLSTPCVYLCDDLTAELDQKHMDGLLELFSQTSGQFFITALSDASFKQVSSLSAKSFLLQEGKIQELSF